MSHVHFLVIATFEFRNLYRTPQTIVSLLVFFAFGVLSFPYIHEEGASDLLNIGRNVAVNSPYFISAALLILSVFSTFFVPHFIANTVIKDFECRFDEILFSTPITKKDYLVGRFLGAFAILMIAIAAAPLGMLIGPSLFQLDKSDLVEISILHYIFVYFVLVFPTVLAVSSLIFAVAVLMRDIIYAYLATMGLLLLLYFAAVTLSAPTGTIIENLALVLDPFMIAAFFNETGGWTANERNTELVTIDGIVLLNRAFWLGISVVLITISVKYFSFRKPAKKSRIAVNELTPTIPLAEAPQITNCKKWLVVRPSWSRKTALIQFIFKTKSELKLVFTSAPFLILLVMSSLMLVVILTNREVSHGAIAYPLTRVLVLAITQNLYIPLILVTIFYSSEIIWSERVARFNEIVDAVPVPNWVFVVSKLISLLAILLSIVLLGIGLAIALQVISGYSSFELGLYLERGVFYFMLPVISVAVLSCFIQVLVNNRFIGIVIMLLYLAFSILMYDLGLEHPLYQYGIGGIDAPLSDMNGSGRFIIAGYWLRAYWISIAAPLLLLTYILWSRGSFQPLKYRLRRLALLKSPTFATPVLVSMLCMLGTGSFIFYNTNVLNDYVTRDEEMLYRVEYEKRFRQYEDFPMPRVVDISIEVDIYPYKRRVETRAEQIIQNKTTLPIESVHLEFPRNLQVVTAQIEGGQLHFYDNDYNYYIFDLSRPMLPGEQRKIQFETLIQQQGFKHSQRNLTLLRNGTFLTNDEIVPHVGFSRNLLISDNDMRRRYGLEPLENLWELEDSSQYIVSRIRKDSDFVNLQATVSTAASQTAITVGYLQDQWTENDRRYFSYKMDVPIMNFYPLMSAEYEVVREHWNGIEIEVFYHKPHTYNVNRMIQSVKDSLTYFGEAFGPYQYQQVRILEYPAYRGFSQSFANTIAYSESNGFVTMPPVEGGIDVPYYVTSHELAHQWWGHQVTPARVEGAQMLLETLAQYSALLLMEQTYGEDQIRKFLKSGLDGYLRMRAADREGEVPVNRALNQGYLAYLKGNLVMYALKDYVGEDVINRALQHLLSLRAYSSNPYAVSTDFLDLLKEEAGPEYLTLIEDLFEKITMFDLSVTDARVSVMRDGRFQVQIDVDISKFYVDAEGKETEAVFDFPIDVGIFAKSPSNVRFVSSDVILLEKRQLEPGDSTIEFIVEQEPTVVGIDPYLKLIDRNSNDNLYVIE